MINEAIFPQRKTLTFDLKNANLCQRTNCFIRKDGFDRGIFNGLTQTKKTAEGVPVWMSSGSLGGSDGTLAVEGERNDGMPISRSSSRNCWRPRARSADGFITLASRYQSPAFVVGAECESTRDRPWLTFSAIRSMARMMA